MQTYLVLIAIFAIMAIALTRKTWKCPACDFQTNNEADAQRHQASHARHKPVYRA